MTEQEEFRKYMLKGMDKRISLVGCFGIDILLILCSMPLFVLEDNKVLFFMISFSPAVIYFISVIRLKEKSAIQGVSYILHKGIMASCFTYLFVLDTLELLHPYPDQIKDHPVYLISTLLGSAYVVFIVGGLVMNACKRQTVTDIKRMRPLITVVIVSSFGSSLPRVFTSDLSPVDTLRALLCTATSCLAFLSVMDISNIFKYRYIIKHPELVNERESVSDQ